MLILVRKKRVTSKRPFSLKSEINMKKEAKNKKEASFLSWWRMICVLLK
jgi:hypothetical protein